MLVIGLVLVLAAGVVVVRSATTGDGTGDGVPPPLTSVAPDPSAASLPISVSGDRIVRDGQPWWFTGYNSFTWSGNCGTPEERMTSEQVEAWFASMRHDGHGAVRLFFFRGWNLERLDDAVESARRQGVYVMLTLDDALGDCGESTKDADWFADSTERADYEQHMTMLLERYRGDPTIAWFEYFNEPGQVDGALRAFYDEMGAVAEGVDPGRLFSSGTLAPYALGGEDAYRDVHESPGVDIASLHEYDEEQVESVHAPGARQNAGGKPVVVGEFGIMAGRSCPIDFAERARRVDAKISAYLDAGFAGALVWAWQPGGGSRCVYGNVDQDLATQAVVRGEAP